MARGAAWACLGLVLAAPAAAIAPGSSAEAWQTLHEPRFEAVQPPGAPLEGPVRGIAEDADGLIWAVSGATLWRWDGYRAVRARLRAETAGGVEESPVMQTVRADAEGELWAGTARGVYRIDRRWPSRPALEPLPIAGDPPSVLFIDFQRPTTTRRAPISAPWAPCWPCNAAVACSRRPSPRRARTACTPCAWTRLVGSGQARPSACSAGRWTPPARRGWRRRYRCPGRGSPRSRPIPMGGSGSARRTTGCTPWSRTARSGPGPGPKGLRPRHAFSPSPWCVPASCGSAPSAKACGRSTPRAGDGRGCSTIGHAEAASTTTTSGRCSPIRGAWAGWAPPPACNGATPANASS